MTERWISGFCGNGLHEGSKPVSRDGLSVQTCKWEFSRNMKGDMILCACDCHETVTQMFEMLGTPRVIVENPEYRPTHRTWWMPTDDPNFGLNPLIDGDVPVVTVDRTAHGAPVPPVRARDYAPTPTGRMARGQLEYRVKEVCDLFVAGELEIDFCTPKEVALVLDPTNPPSVGAIDAIFKRWTELGFAVVLPKPTRFHTYTPEGYLEGLDRLKDKRKRQQKSRTAAQRRGERV